MDESSDTDDDDDDKFEYDSCAKKASVGQDGAATSQAITSKKDLPDSVKM
jgi:hypothetical protein